MTLPRNLESITNTTDLDYDMGLIRREVTRIKDFARLSLNDFDSDKLLTEIQEKYGYIKENDYASEW